MARVVPGHGVVAWWLGLEMSERDKKASHQASKNKHAQPPKHSFLPFFFAALFFKSADEPTLWFATFTHHFTTLSLLEKETREKKQDMSRHTEWCVSDCAQHHSHTLHLPRFTPPPLIFSACMVAHGCLLALKKYPLSCAAVLCLLCESVAASKPTCLLLVDNGEKREGGVNGRNGE